MKMEKKTATTEHNIVLHVLYMKLCLYIFLPFLFFSFGISGVSPQHANEFSDEEKTKIESELKLSDCRSIGPIGLDYKLTNISKEQQMLAFEEQVCSIYEVIQ